MGDYPPGPTGEARRTTRERFRALTDALPALVFVTDAVGHASFANTRFLEYTGFAEQALRSGGWLQVVHPRDAGHVAEAWYQSVRTGRSYEAEGRLRRHDGEYCWHMIRAEPVLDAHDEIAEWFGTCVDITEHKRAEESQALLAAIVAASDDAIVSKTLDSVIRTWNAGAERLFGYTAAEAIGRPITMVIPPERHEEERAILARLRQGERVDHFETIRLTKDGRLIDVSLTISPVLDASGRVIGASKIARDITDRKRAEALLHEREQRYALVLDGSGAAIWDWNVPERRVLYSSRWKQLRGYDDDEISDSENEWRKGIHPDDVERVMDALQAHFDGRTEAFAEEYRVWHKAGYWVWIYDRGIALRNEAGEVVRMAGSETDITERKRAEEALRLNQARLRTREAQYRELVQNANSAILRWRSDGIVTFANTFAETLFGYSPGELIGQHASVMLPVEDGTGADTSRLVAEVAAHPERYRDNVNENVARDGRRIWMHWTNRPLYDERGDLVEILAIGSDITRLKQAEESLREADRRKDEFLAVLGHELRNPLAPLRTGVELLEHAEEQPGLVVDVREMMQRQLHHLMRLVDDLVDVSRISRGQLELEHALLDLRGVAAAAIELTRPLIDERGHELTVHEPAEAVRVRGDFERLVQIVGNVLNNAARYTLPSGAIELESGAADDQAFVRVRDSGLGIPPERLGGLFEMFSQVPEHRGHVTGSGLGIGLAIARELVARHDGTISAASQGLGHGSEFVVRLPLATAEAAAAGADQAAATSAGSRTRRVLVVDDNVDAAQSLAMILDFKGHTVAIANDGASALEQIEQFGPHVVLLDIGLPDIDGLEVARRIRALPQGAALHVVAVTGWGQEEDRQRTRDAGIDEHLTKPIDPHHLDALISGG